MSANVTYLKSSARSREWPLQPSPEPADWTNAELAELYRVENSLVQGGMTLWTDRGVTDEGDPWFSFMRADGNVIVHIAKLNGAYHLISPALPRPLIGANFSEITKSFTRQVPVVPLRAAAAGPSGGSAMLTLLVAVIYFALEEIIDGSGSAQAAEALGERALAEGDGGAAASADELAEKKLEKIIAQQIAQSRVAEAASSDVYSRAWSLVQAVALGSVFSLASVEVADAELATGYGSSALDTLPSGSSTSIDSAEFARHPAADDASFVAVAQSAGHADHIVDWAESLNVSMNELAGGGAGAASHSAYGPSASSHAQSAAGDRDVAANYADDAVRYVVRDGETIVLPANARAIIIVAEGSGRVDVSAATELSSVTIEGAGALEFVGLRAEQALGIEIARGAMIDLTLAYVDLPSSMAVATISGPEITLSGGATLKLDLIAPSNAPPDAVVQLTIVSEGDDQNSLTMDAASDEVAAKFVVVGEQDLVFNQTAAQFSRDFVDASHFDGALTVGVDLAAVSSGLFAVSNGNIVGNSNSTIALANVADEVKFQFDVSLQKVLIGGSLNNSSGASTIVIELGSSNGVNFGILGAPNARDLLVLSEGAGNVIGVLDAPSLAAAYFAGDGQLTIGKLVGLSGVDGGEITIDARDMRAKFSIDFGDVTSTGVTVNVFGGAADDVITARAGDDKFFLDGMGGSNRYNVDQGMQSVTIAGLKAGDKVVVGNGGIEAAFINAASEFATLQSQIDALTTLNEASSFVSSLLEATGTQSAVLFSYRGEMFVNIEMAGNKAFDFGVDSLIKVAGLSQNADLDGVFFVA